MKVIPVSNAVHVQYADEVADKLAQAGVRVERDVRDEKLGYKIREAQMQKIPYVLVIGDKEMENGAVNVRKYGKKNQKLLN
ncbi:His/Gly/Thr/Pro-type tRNA ligase C-terminal domain-containing protein [Bacillus paranthracis]